MSERRIHAASPCLARLFLSSDPARACSRLEEPAGWVAAKAKKGDLVFKLMPRLPSAEPAFGLPKAVAMQPDTAARTAPAPEPEPQPAPPAMLAAPADEDPDDGDGGAADAAAAAATAAKAAAAAATAAAKAEHEQRQKAAAARKEREKQEAAAAAAARSAPVAAAPTPAPAPAPLGLPPSAAAPRPSSGGGGGGRVDTVAIEAKTRSQMEPLAERLTVAMRLLCSKRPAEPYAFLATAFRRYVIAPASLLPAPSFPFPFPFLSCSSLSCSRLEPTPTGR